MICDLHFKRTMWQTKGIVGKKRVKVGRPVEMATSVIHTRDDSGSNGGNEKLSEFDTDW